MHNGNSSTTLHLRIREAVIYRIPLFHARLEDSVWAETKTCNKPPLHKMTLNKESKVREFSPNNMPYINYGCSHEVHTQEPVTSCANANKHYRIQSVCM